jgi:hypothetical protein
MRLGDRRELLSELFDAGFVAMIVAVREDRLPPSLLGRVQERLQVLGGEQSSHGGVRCLDIELAKNREYPVDTVEGNG